MPGAYWCMVEDDRQGAPKKVMAEVLGEASRLAGAAGAPAEAVWVTDKATPEGLTQLGEWGAKRVWLFENAAFAPYRAEVWTPVVAELAGKEAPQAIFAPVTTRQREFMARLAARLGAGLSADSTVLTADGGKLVATRPVYAGKLLAKMTWAKTPWMATLRPNVFRPGDDAGGAAAVEKPAASIPAETMKLVERKQEAPGLALFGRQAIDDDMGAVAAQVAELLGWPCASWIMEQAVDEGGKTIRVARQVEGGLEIFDLPLPAVASAQKGLNEPRYPTLKGIMGAKKKEIKDVKAADLGLAAKPPALSVVKLESLPPRPPGRIIQGEPAAAAKELVRALREDAKAI